MVFSSLPFLFGYLPLTLLAYFITPLRWRNAVLLVVSLIFYGWGEPVYITIMFLSTLIDYTHGILVEKYREEDAAPILVDRERIRAMGLELEEYPVASEGGDYARHDPDRLAAAVLDVYRRRAVRIFRGEQRYIIEE